MAQLNYEVLRQNTLDELQHRLDTPRKTDVHQARKIIRKSTQYELRTQSAYKHYQLVFNKRLRCVIPQLVPNLCTPLLLFFERVRV